MLTALSLFQMAQSIKVALTVEYPMAKEQLYTLMAASMTVSGDKD